MDTLREIKNLVADNPNDSDLGSKIRQYVEEHKIIHIRCCDKSENIVTFVDEDSHPYGRTVTEKVCKECGKIISTIID